MGQRFNLLSLFDGIGGAHVALDRAGVPVSRRYTAEIDPYASQVVRKNYPDAVELGDIRNVNRQTVGEPVDLLCAGFPCQDLSRANVKGQGIRGDRSGLAYEMARVVDELQPRRLLVENVVPTGRRAEDDIREISKMLGVDPVMRDAANYGPMKRQRLWWTDIPLTPPANSPAVFRDALQPAVPDRYLLSDRATEYMYRPAGKSGRTHFERHGFDINDPKARTIPSVIYKGVPYNAVRLDDGTLRRLTPEEIEGLFGFPRGYTGGLSDTQRYRTLGNSWSVDDAADILDGLLR